MFKKSQKKKKKTKTFMRKLTLHMFEVLQYLFSVVICGIPCPPLLRSLASVFFCTLFALLLTSTANCKSI